MAMFTALMPLLLDRAVTITLSRVDDKICVNIIPATIKEGENAALTTPLTCTASPEELDAELGTSIAGYVTSHSHLTNTLTDAKATMDAAAKTEKEAAAAKQKTANDKKVAATGKPVVPAKPEAPSLFLSDAETSEDKDEEDEEKGAAA